MKWIITSVLVCLTAGWSYAQKVKVQPIQSVIDVRLGSPTDYGDGKFFIHLETEEVHECSNWPIIYQLEKVGNRIEIKIRGYADTGPCLATLGPAKADVDLSDLKDGDYSIRIKYRNYKGLYGKLVIDSEAYRLYPEKEGMFKLGNPILRRRPANLVWGKIEYGTKSLYKKGKQFLHDIENEGCEVTDLEPGNYGEFFIREKGRQSERIRGNNKFELPFVYYFEGDVERLRLLIKMYADQYGDVMKISLFDSEGKRFLSWTMKD